MQVSFKLILVVAGIVCFGIAAFVPAPVSGRLVPAGLFCWCLSTVV